MNTGMIEVFRSKLESQRKKIRKLLNHPKKSRNRDFLRSLIREAKRLKKLVSSIDDQRIITCPHCHGTFHSSETEEKSDD